MEIRGFFGARMRVKRLLKINILTLAAISIMVCCPDLAKAALPEFGSFDIDGTSTPSFDQIPSMGMSMYVYPFAAPDDDLYTELGSLYNLGEIQLFNGSVNFTDSGEKSGNLGIRIVNSTAGVETFQESILTLDLGVDIFNVYLPELSFDMSEQIFLWVAQSGATYYATALQGAGLPDITATDAIAAGNLARAPEPATMLLLGLGAFVLRKKRY